MTPVTLVVSVDTEEDNWTPARSGVTTRNVGEIPKLDAIFDRLGVRATYFTTYSVAQDPRAVAVLRALHSSGRAEIGAHLHPWNTPPLREPPASRNTMLKNLSAALQLEKVRALTQALETAFGTRPRAFRAGRYGLGTDTVSALVACGYEVDSSVTPFVSWEAFDEGPNFLRAPIYPYRLSPNGGDVRDPSPAGTLLELPLSVSLNRHPFRAWRRMWDALHSPLARRMRIKGVAARLGILRSVFLNPEIATAPDMLWGARGLLAEGLRYVHLTLHSPSLTPGLSPFVATRGDRERLFESITRFVEGLANSVPLRFATVSEAAAQPAELVVDARVANMRAVLSRGSGEPRDARVA